MRQRDQGSATDSEPQGLFHEGPAHREPATAVVPGRPDSPDPSEPHDLHEDDASFFDDYETEADDGHLPHVRRTTRRERLEQLESGGRHARTRRKRNRRFITILAALLVLVVGVSVWLIVVPIYHYLNPADYSGAGTGTTIVTVHADDDATDIGTTLHNAGVVASVRSFTDAASNDSKSQDIQPGSYRLRHHMSADSALSLLLTPSARVNADVLVAEGATTLDIEKRLTAPTCTASASASTACGPGMSVASVKAALRNVKALGLPTDYTSGGKTPASVEGFLFPATYYFPDKTKPSDALQQMISKFADQARATNFTTAAKAQHLTPYEQLIVASIAQAEAKYPADFAKVARVIMNRLRQHIPLRIDATSAYAAKLRNLDPTKVIYADVRGPYNTYNHLGLPPTPVGNPGVEAMNGAAHPAAGTWLFYVNADAAGHLGFYTSEKDFEAAVVKCRTNHWGCG